MLGSRRWLVHGTGISLILALVLLAACELSLVTLGGEIRYTDTVEGARISVMQGAGIHELGAPAGPYWTVQLPLETEQPFRVVAEGGTVNGVPFAGTLSAYVPWEDPSADEDEEWFRGQPVNVTLLSSIVDRYMAQEGLDYDTALEETLAYFELDEDVLTWGPAQIEEVFSSAEFQARAAPYGGFEPYMAQILSRIGSGDTERMLPLMEEDEAKVLEEIVVQVARTSLKRWAAELLWTSFAAGIGSAVGKQAMAQILPMMGFNTFEGQVKGKLEAIRAQLNVIEGKIDENGQKLDNLLSSLETTYFALVNEQARQTLVDSANTIENQFYNMRTMYTGMNGDVSEQQTANFANSILYQHDLDGCFYAVYAAIKGPSGGATGALQALTNKLADGLRKADYGEKNDQLLLSYYTLDRYFRDLIALQMKAAALMFNALNFQEQTGAKTFEGTAGQYMELKVKPLMEEEIDYFLICVEQLVAAAADVRTVVVNSHSMFPPATAEVFMRADLMAAEFSERHRGGLVVRYLGDPTIAQKFYALNPELYKWDYRALAQTGDFYVKTHTIEGTPQAVVYLPDAGGTAAERFYKAPLPTNTAYTAPYYLGWSKQEGVYNFYPQTRLAFCKVIFADPFGGEDFEGAWLNRTIRSPLGKNFDGWAAFMKMDPETGEPMLPEILEGTGFFGHGTIVCRNEPRWTSVETQEFLPSIGEWVGHVWASPITGRIETEYTLRSRYTGLYDTCDGTASLSLMIRNGQPAAGRDDAFRLSSRIVGRADTDQFDHAAYNGITGASTLKINFDWELQVDGEQRLGYEKANYYPSWRGSETQSRPYDRRLKRTYEDEVDFQLASNKFHRLTLRSSENRIRTTAIDFWGVGDNDAGSTIEFEHKIEHLELVPR